MEKTFIFNTKIAESILENYKDFLTLNNNQNNSDEYKVRILGLLRELNIEQFSKVLEKSFEASLKKEEGIHHNFSFVLSPPENKFNDLPLPHTRKDIHGAFNDVCTFEAPIDIELLPKIAPAFESTNKKLRIWFNNENEIQIWGFASLYFDYFGLEIKSFSPGQLLIHIKSQDFPYKRYLMTISEGKRVTGNDNLIDLLFDESEIRKFGDAPHRRQKRYWFLIDVINKVMNHKHGGTLLFIPQEKSETILEESIKKPILYKPHNRYEYIERTLLREEDEMLRFDQAGKKHADFLAQITAIDGAAIINKNFGVLAFGAKIKPKEKSKSNDENDTDKLERVWITEPFENFVEQEIELSKLGGMRHQSTAQFVFDQREKDVFAIIASEDGKVSIVFWDKVKKKIIVLRHIEYLFYGK